MRPEPTSSSVDRGSSLHHQHERSTSTKSYRSLICVLTTGARAELARLNFRLDCVGESVRYAKRSLYDNPTHSLGVVRYRWMKTCPRSTESRRTHGTATVDRTVPSPVAGVMYHHSNTPPTPDGEPHRRSPGQRPRPFGPEEKTPPAPKALPGPSPPSFDLRR